MRAAGFWAGFGVALDRLLESACGRFLVGVKGILTRLGLRQTQSCKRCGRNTVLDFTVDDELWSRLPELTSTQRHATIRMVLLLGDGGQAREGREFVALVTAEQYAYRLYHQPLADP